MTELTLGAILWEARRRYGWTLRDAERATGIPNAHISQLETGAIAAPGITVLVKLAKAYGLPLRRLLDAAGQGADWALVTEASEAEIRASERERIAADLERRANEMATEGDTGDGVPPFTATMAVAYLDAANLIREKSE